MSRRKGEVCRGLSQGGREGCVGREGRGVSGSQGGREGVSGRQGGCVGEAGIQQGDLYRAALNPLSAGGVSHRTGTSSRLLILICLHGRQ